MFSRRSSWKIVGASAVGAPLAARAATGPAEAPTVTLDGGRDPFTPAGGGAAYRDKFRVRTPTGP